MLLDRALTLDPRNEVARALDADVTLARLQAAERSHDRELKLASLESRLALYDDGSRRARLRATGHVRVLTDPPGAALTLARYREDGEGHLVETDAAPFPSVASGASVELAPGSYVLHAALPARYPTVYPLLVRRGESLDLRVVLPPAADVPDGMIYVPAGRIRYGSSDDEDSRGFLAHQPVHDAEVGAFLIAQREVTNGDYLAYLEALTPAERAGRLPDGLVLAKSGRIVWQLRDRVLLPGEPLCTEDGCVDWSRLPVDGASREDGEHFLRSGSRDRAVYAARGSAPIASGSARREGPTSGSTRTAIPRPAPKDARTLITHGGASAAASSPSAVGIAPRDAKPLRRSTT